MGVGIGLPATIPGAAGRNVIEWARRAEQAGFSSLGPVVGVAGASCRMSRKATQRPQLSIPGTVQLRWISEPAP